MVLFQIPRSILQKELLYNIVSAPKYTIANYATDDCRKILNVDELIAFSKIRLYMQILIVVFQESGEQWASVVVLVWAVAGDLPPDRAEMQPVFFADTKLSD